MLMTDSVLLQYIINFGAAAYTAGNGGNNGSRCRCGDGPGAGVAAGPPTPPISDALGELKLTESKMLLSLQFVLESSFVAQCL